ncbi:MAG: hypothetical protein U0L05_04130 [Schaedlerella sp.]|nr:hypothetical protein [Schaedlerella sp.]
MNTTVFSIISVFVTSCGIYGLYAYIRMKTGGPINKALLLGEGFPEEKCKDKEEFRARSMPALLIFSIVTILFGVCDLIHCGFKDLGFIHAIAMMVFFIVLLWFMVVTTKLKKELF